MNKSSKKWFVIAVALISVGMISFSAVMIASGWDFSKLSTVQYETNTHFVLDEFNSISVDSQTADIIFAPSNDGRCKIICYESESAKHRVLVQDGTLTVLENNEKSGLNRLGSIWNRRRLQSTCRMQVTIRLVYRTVQVMLRYRRALDIIRLPFLQAQEM